MLWRPCSTLVYRQTPLRTVVCKQRNFWPHMVLQGKVCTQKYFCTRTPVHTDVFTHKGLFAQRNALFSRTCTVVVWIPVRCFCFFFLSIYSSQISSVKIGWSYQKSTCRNKSKMWQIKIAGSCTGSNFDCGQTKSMAYVTMHFFVVAFKKLKGIALDGLAKWTIRNIFSHFHVQIIAGFGLPVRMMLASQNSKAMPALWKWQGAGPSSRLVVPQCAKSIRSKKHLCSVLNDSRLERCISQGRATGLWGLQFLLQKINCEKLGRFFTANKYTSRGQIW